MDKPKIFISHSAHRDPSARPALDTIEDKLKTLDKDYSILLDHSTLRPGEDWRSTINLWCGGCDAAILLITPDSMVADYCLYEWSILSYRKSVTQNFHILPVYFNTKPEDLRGKPHQISEIQGIGTAVVYSTIGAIWPTIQNWLQTVVPLDNKPSAMQAYLIANLLRGAINDPNHRELRLALQQTRLPLGTWEPLQDEWEQFAFLLLGLGLRRAAPALAQLFPSFDGDVNDWKDVLELIACSWVDRRSAETLRSRARGTCENRTVALNAEQGETARLYVIKASDVRPSGTWAGADVSAVVASIDELENQTARALAAALGLNASPVDRERLSTKLKNLEIARKPVVAYLRSNGLSQEWLTHLRGKFPSVTFFLLSGSDRPLFEKVEWLEPELEASFEMSFWNDYESISDALVN